MQGATKLFDFMESISVDEINCSAQIYYFL